jgi:hypothetical protein
MRAAVWVVLGVVWWSAAWGGLNPADPGLPTAQAFGRTYDNNAASSMCLDCHTASPKPGGTHFVSHYDGSAVRPTGNLAYERLVAWPGGAFLLSKYAVPAPPDPLAASVTGQQGQVICESCHNLSRNAAGGNNLLEPYRDLADPTGLCQGCHPAQAAGLPAHHPLTVHITDPTRPAWVRYPPTPGSGVPDLGAWDRVTCTSCHGGHGAQLETAARVLRRGWSAVTGIAGVLGQPVNVFYYLSEGGTPGTLRLWNTGDTVPGIDRQADVDALSPPAGDGVPRLVSNRDPLCDACHTYND